MDLNTNAVKKLPTQKVTLGAGIGALAIVLVWGFSELLGVSVPAEIGIAFSTFCTFVAQHLVSGE